MNELKGNRQLFPSRASPGRNAFWIVFVALVYFAAARLGLALVLKPEGIAPIWLPSGIFLSAILLTRHDVRPLLVAALCVTDFVAEMLAGTPILVSLIYALELAGDAVLSSWLLIRFLGEPISFRKSREVIGFLALAVILSNGLTSLIAAAASGLIPGTSFWISWRWWAASDGIGNLLLTPFILSWAPSAKSGMAPWNSWRVLEGAALFIPLAVLNFFAFGYMSDSGLFSLLLPYTTFPFLLWAALRFGIRGVSLALIILASVILPFAVADRLPPFFFYGYQLRDTIIVQLYLVIMAIPSLFLGTVVAERRQAKETLGRSEALLNKAEEIAHVGSWELDLTTDRLIWSDEVYRIFGLSPQSFGATYQAFLDAVHPDDRAAVDAAYARSLREGKDIYEIEHRVVRKSTGEIRSVHEKCEHVRDSSGRIIRSIGMVHDITERKRVEEALQRSQQSLKSTFASLRDAFFLVDVDTAIIRECNPAASEVFGYDVREMVGRTTAFLHVDEKALAEFRCLLSAAVEERGFLFLPEFAMKRKDGTVFPTEHSVVPILEEGKRVGWVSIVRDLTERKRAQEALIRTEERYRLIFESSPLPMWVYDMKTLQFLAVNEAAVKNYGYTEEEFLSMTIRDIRPQEDVTALETLVPRIPHGLANTGEWRHRKKDGTIIRVSIHSHDVDLRGRRARLVLAEDITERKRIEEALRESEERFRSLVEQAGDGFELLDTEGRYIDVNSSTCRQLGYAKEELLGRSIHDIDPLVSPEQYAERFQSLVGGSPVTFETVHRRKDGTMFPVEITTSVIQLGDSLSALTLVRDIAERKRTEEERKKLQEQLIQSQKLESIGQLAGGIAHDFNNVLAAIVGYGNILQMKMRPEDPSRTYIEQVLAAAERAAGLTQSLLAFSRKQVINPENIDLNTVIQKVNILLSRIIGEDVSLTMTLCSEPLIIFADSIQIEQVLMNLSTNARDAMPKGGMLVIETGRAEFDEAQTVTHRFGKAGSYAVLSVTDTGTGMDEQTQAKIFDPFFTTKEIGRGTGLGLAIVYGVVKQNNGHINIYSEIGKGTTFKIYLPLVAASIDSKHGSADPATIHGGKETILLVEDDKPIRELFQQVLSEYGYRVIEAEDGDEALKKFLDQFEAIDLVVTDIIMPRKSGHDFYEEALRRKPGIKVIFTSGYPSDLIQKVGILDNKDVHFLSKPSSPQTLLLKVRETLDQPAQ